MKPMILAIILAVSSLAAPAAAADQPRSLTSLFPQLPDWRMAETADLFLPDTLYEHINGAAENFLNYGFEQLAVQTYTREQRSLNAEIYFHGRPENAFGIYSSEKPLNGKYFTIGGQAYAEDGVLNFVSGAYYVKLNSFGLGPESEAVLTDLARRIAGAINGSNALPEILEAFPAVGRQAHSERFILNNFLGHDFLRSAYVADYLLGSRRFQLFVISAGSEENARAMLEKYAALDKASSGKEIRPGALTVNDPYNGPMQLIWRGKFIYGGNEGAAVDLLEELGRKLTKLEAL